MEDEIKEITLGCTVIKLSPDGDMVDLVMTNKGRVKDEEREFTVRTSAKVRRIKEVADELLTFYENNSSCSKCGRDFK